MTGKANPSLDNLRVLFRPHAARHEALAEAIALAKARYGWRIGIMTLAPNAGPFADLLDYPGDFFQLPNLNRRPEWHSDPAKCQRVHEMVRNCERATGLPIHRVVLAGERVIGRGFGQEFYHWPNYSLTRRVLADNAEPGRVIEHQFGIVSDIFDRFKPDLVMSGNFSSPEMIVAYMICRLRGIPCIANRPSKILSHRGFLSDDQRMLNDATAVDCQRRIETGATPSDNAKKFLEEFRNRPRTVAYIRQNWANTRSFLRQHLDVAWLAALEARYRLRGREGMEPRPAWGSLIELYRTQYLVRRQRALFKTFDENELTKIPYLYLALHKEPELAINVQHPEWHSQKNLIATLSANLPAGYRLFVREHRFNEGRRPTRFYKDILAYPGVTLINAFDPQFKYIRHAALIVTDNGTTGWEGLIFRKPVLLVGDNYYSASTLAPIVDAPARFGEAILSLLQSPPITDAEEWDRRLCAMIDAEFATTLPDTDVDGMLKSLAGYLNKQGSSAESAAS